ncbi:hypothetical protein [Mycobacterium persicum]|uniref:hypothetical protein n=1 Tax=Mycobacterium persicum TaxID=1487726 RepID=UPI000C08995C|nr:hypothetical protein [Mycobacterium persicum]
MTALTVVLAPHAQSEDILAVLADYSAVGLLRSFAWVDAAAGTATALPATMVTDGQMSPVVLQQVLTARKYDRVRLAVLVPVEAPLQSRIPLAVEQFMEQVVRSSAIGAPITLLRLLYTPGAAAALTADAALVLEGWHNLFIAPEDPSGPELAAVALDRLTDPLDVARYVAPVVAGVTGLWVDIDKTPFDALAVLPGLTIRAVRAFYRELDTADVEARLRAQLFDPTGRLPLPRADRVPVVFIDDVPTATQSMARALWTKHRDVLRGPRMSLGGEGAQRISMGTALKMFLSFLASALWRAPSAWMSSALGSVSSVVATTVQTAVFGRSGSAYDVVAGAEPASWQDLGRSADTLGNALAEPSGGQHLAQQDLSRLWTDFVNVALSLADGGRRSESLEPVRVGAAVGVVRNCSDVVPSADDRFAAIPGSLAAVTGVSAVEATDLLGVAALRDRLQRTYGDPAAGVEARRAAAALDGWQQTVSKSYAWQVGSILVDFLQRARSEVAGLVQQIRSTGNRDAVEQRLSQRQHTTGMILKTFGWSVFGVLALLAGAAALGWGGWKFALVTGGVLLALYLVIALALFLLTQRDLFAEMNLRQSQAARLNAMHSNLRSAVQDLSRLSGAYGQLLAWSRVLGAVLRAPFGSAAAPSPPSGQLVDGLPTSTHLGIAMPSSDDMQTAIDWIEHGLYSVGWLTRPWEDMLADAGKQLREAPAALFVMPGVGTGSALDKWSAAVASGQIRAKGADALWQRVKHMLTESPGPVGDTITRAVFVPVSGRTVPEAEFSTGVTDHRPERAAPFAGSLFTDAAITAGRSAAVLDESVMTRRGLGYRAVVVQASDGLLPYDFAVFAPRTSMATSPDATTDHDEPPGSGKLVF